jgi:putative ABC transport system permease protein
MSEYRSIRPPRLAEWLLRSCLPGGVTGDSILGDAREELLAYAAAGGIAPRLWYCFHALGIARAYAGEVVMDGVLKDLRFAMRSLLRQPGSAVLSVLILALGIGLSTFMFSLIYGVLVRGLDVPESDRIAVIERVDIRDLDQGGTGVASHDFLDYRERTRSFEGLAGYYGGSVTLADDRAAGRYQGVWATANTFDLLRVRPILGRTFAAGEDAPGLSPTVVLSYDVWRDRYDSDPGVVGQDVRVNGDVGTVVGVMPEGFRWPSNHDLWITTQDDPLAATRGEGRRYAVRARIADGVSWDRAELDLADVAGQLEREHPELNEGISARLLTVSQQQNGDEIALIFTAMMIAVLCVLLVACANVANLLLARAATRTRLAGVRAALGAGRWRVVFPFFAEALVLAIGGAVLGTALAWWMIHLFDAATVPALSGRPYFVKFTLDLPVLLYVVAVTMFTALAAGMAPAIQVSRADLNNILKDEARGSSSFHMGRLSRGLVIVEVALSVALLIGAGLMTRSIVQLGRAELPFEADAYMTGRIGLLLADYPERTDRQNFWLETERRIAADGSVAAVAISSAVPGVGPGIQPIRLEGQTYQEETDRPTTHAEIVSAGYFDLLGTSPVEGEGFSEVHTQESERVAIVNRSFAERFWPGSSAIGRRFRTGTADTVPWMTVIGVVPDLHLQGFRPTGSPGSNPDGFYVPMTQSDPTFMNIVALPRSGGPLTLATPMRDAVRTIDPDVPLYDLQPVRQAIHRASWYYTVFGSVFIAFGAAALFMATAGLYGVLSFSVSRRTQEMGIRMALGAESRQVIRLILRQGVMQLVVGVVIGLGIAAGLSSIIGFAMYRVNPRDPAVFGGVVATIVTVGLIAALMPALRATRVDPLVALRAE